MICLQLVLEWWPKKEANQMMKYIKKALRVSNRCEYEETIIEARYKLVSRIGIYTYLFLINNIDINDNIYDFEYRYNDIYVLFMN